MSISYRLKDVKELSFHQKFIEYSPDSGFQFGGFYEEVVDTKKSQIAMALTTEYKLINTEQISVSCALMCVFEIQELDKASQEDIDGVMPILFGVAYGTMRGYLKAKATIPPFNQYVLPVVDPREMYYQIKQDKENISIDDTHST